VPIQKKILKSTYIKIILGFFFPTWSTRAGPALLQRSVVRSLSGRFNSRWRNLDKRSQW